MLYSTGVAVVLVLEKGFEGRRGHGGFGGAVAAALQSTNAHHVWANAICISGALLVYNIMAVVRRHLDEGGLIRMLARPLPAEPHAAGKGSIAPNHVPAGNPEASR
jgi:hypothetical protein